MATSDTRSQNVVLCNLCDLCDKSTHDFCNSCQVSLCEKCVKKHRVDFQSLIHDIVPFLDRKIQLVCPECQHHPGQRCEANCLQCSEPVCFRCVISGPHKRHEIEELTKTYDDIKKKIEKDKEEIKNKSIPEYQRKHAELENSMSRTKTMYDDIKTESEKLRKLWHQEVDSIFDKLDSMSQSHREENINFLQEYHTKIRKLISCMYETVEQNEKLLKSKKWSEVSKYMSKLKEYQNCPEKLDSHMPTLDSKIDHGKELSIKIGYFSAILKQLPQNSLPDDVFHSTKRIWEVNENASIIATIPTDYKNVLGVACVGDAEAWISGNNRTITRVDIHGIVKDTLTTTCQFGPCGIALTRKGELIFIDRDNATVNIVRHGKSMTLITTPWGWVPWGLYCTRSGDILVHISFFFDKHKIIRYQEQRKTQEIVNDRQGKPIFEDGLGKLYMSENNNGDICVSDTSANTVVVVDKTERVRFRCDGKQAFREKTFVPKDIVTDKFSQIIVADYNNNCLHILDQNGQFLRCVDKCGLEKPHELSVDSKGRLWVGCESGKIKLIQYLTKA